MTVNAQTRSKRYNQNHLIQSTLLIYTDTEGAIGGRINGVSVLSGLNLEKMTGLSFPGDKANSP